MILVLLRAGMGGPVTTKVVARVSTRDAACQHVWFTRTHRFAEGSGIAALATSIRDGDSAAVQAMLGAAGHASLQRIPGERELSALLSAGYADLIDALLHAADDAAALLHAFDRFRVLCAVRQGRRGAERMNRICEEMLRAALAQRGSAAGQQTWYPGRPVLILRNDYLV